jgi:superoxide dismutase, Cu-Zn family
MPARSRRHLIGASIALLAALAGTIAAWPATSSAAVVPQASADLVNASNVPLGSVTFLGRHGQATEVRIELSVPSTAPGLNDFHGIHIHANAVCAAPFTSAGGHWDGGGTHTHGAHLGDLPSVLIGADGTASLTTAIARFDVSQLAGHAVILHAGRDNFGNVPVGANADQYTANDAAATTLTANTGNAGARYGCGVIEPVGNN